MTQNYGSPLLLVPSLKRKSEKKLAVSFSDIPRNCTAVERPHKLLPWNRIGLSRAQRAIQIQVDVCSDAPPPPDQFDSVP